MYWSFYGGLCWISGGEEMRMVVHGEEGVFHPCPYMNYADSEAFERVVLLNLVLRIGGTDLKGT
jgi:hypothetical protein